MGKKKKRGGGGGGGGEGGGGGGGQQQQQQKPAEEQAAAASSDAEDTKDDGKEKGKEDTKEKDTKDDGKQDTEKEKGAKGKKPPPPLPVVTAVLKVDMHCDGCAKRIRASVHRYPGVEGVAMEVGKGTMTVVGRFDAKKLRDRVAGKTRKKVDLVGGGGGNAGNKGGGNQHKGDGEEDGKEDKGQEADKGKDDRQEEEKQGNKDDSKGGDGGGKGGKDNKKPVVPVVARVVLKIGSTGLHCDGCMNRIRSKLYKIKGVEQVAFDMAKNQVTVTGTMEVKSLPEKLRKKLRRPVDVVPAGGGKDKEGKQDNKDGKQDNKQEGKDGKQADSKALAAELEAWKNAFYDQQSLMKAEFMLSDENPNACAVM